VVVSVGRFGIQPTYGGRRHPPTLTRNERLRFIRSWYQFWCLLDLDAAGLQSALHDIPLQQLFYLEEMARISEHSTQRGGPVPATTYQSMSTKINPRHIPRECCSLGWAIQKHIEDTYESIHHRTLHAPILDAIEDGFRNFVVMFDHYQPSLKEIVCGGPRWALEKQHLWVDDDPEEER